MKCSTDIRQQQGLQTHFRETLLGRQVGWSRLQTDIQCPQRYFKDLGIYDLNQLKYPLDAREHTAQYLVSAKPSMMFNWHYYLCKMTEKDFEYNL
jgi:hypothetical protein